VDGKNIEPSEQIKTTSRSAKAQKNEVGFILRTEESAPAELLPLTGGSEPYATATHRRA